jgi:hypothetical protein
MAAEPLPTIVPAELDPGDVVGPGAHLSMGEAVLVGSPICNWMAAEVVVGSGLDGSHAADAARPPASDPNEARAMSATATATALIG